MTKEIDIVHLLVHSNVRLKLDHEKAPTSLRVYTEGMPIRFMPFLSEYIRNLWVEHPDKYQLTHVLPANEKERLHYTAFTENWDRHQENRLRVVEPIKDGVEMLLIGNDAIVMYEKLKKLHPFSSNKPRTVSIEDYKKQLLAYEQRHR